MKNTFLFNASLIFLSAVFSYAASPPERASELKQWREQCSDPDYDLRQAYIEQALEKGDKSIQRICIRAALDSSNADIRNLGLRAAIASSNKIFFQVKEPPELQKLKKNAENREKELKRINYSWAARSYEYIKSGLTFIIEDVSLYKGSSVWFPIAKNPERSESAQATIVGDTINWKGNVELVKKVGCNLNVLLAVGGRLEGTLQCEDWYPFPVTAKFF